MVESGLPFFFRAMVPKGIVMISFPSAEVASIVFSILPSLLIRKLTSTPKRFVSIGGCGVPPSPPPPPSDGVATGLTVTCGLDAMLVKVPSAADLDLVVNVAVPAVVCAVAPEVPPP